MRTALLVSHGVRLDTVIYLVLKGGGALAPRSLRIDGATARYLRPDERSLAVLIKKSLAAGGEGKTFVTVRPGIAIANAGLAAVLADLGPTRAFLLDERAGDVRDAAIGAADAAYFIGDHTGFDDATLADLSSIGALRIAVGPVSLHAEDAIAVLSNELDRLDAIGAR